MGVSGRRDDGVLEEDDQGALCGRSGSREEVFAVGGGPVGLSTIAVSVGEEPDTIEEAYEPFLIMEGYLDRTPKGRVATPLAYSRLGLKSET